MCYESRAVGPDSILYSYKRSFNGFVVKLSEQQMHIMSGN